MYQAMEPTLKVRDPKLATRADALAESVFRNTSYGQAPLSDRDTGQ